MPILSTLTQHCDRSSCQWNIARKKIKSIQIRREKIKLSLFKDDMIVYIEKSQGIYRLSCLLGPLHWFAPASAVSRMVMCSFGAVIMPQAICGPLNCTNSMTCELIITCNILPMLDGGCEVNLWNESVVGWAVDVHEWCQHRQGSVSASVTGPAE